MALSQVSPWLGALGSFFGGEAQDQQNQLARSRLQTQDARQAMLDAQGAQMHQAQMGDMAAQADQRRQSTADAVQKAQANQRAFGTLQQIAPTHPLVQGGFNPGVDYIGELSAASKATAEQKKTILQQRRDYNTLKAESPNHPLAQQPFDENNPADYTAALANARDLAKTDSASKAAAALANKPQRVQVDDGNGGVKWAWLKPGEEAKAVSKVPAAKTNPNAMRASAALPQLDDALKTLKQYSDPGAAGRLFGKHTFGGYFVSDEGQNANQGYDQFAQTYLSAKAARNPTPTQVQEIVRQIRPNPGEQSNPIVLAAKARRLQEMRDEVAQIGGGNGPQLPPLTPAQIQRAQTDPAYKSFLQSKGYQ